MKWFSILVSIIYVVASSFLIFTHKFGWSTAPTSYNKPQPQHNIGHQQQVVENQFLQQIQLPQVKINQILYDSDNNLWVATDSKSLWVKKAGKFPFTQVQNSVIDNRMPIFCLKEDSQKHLWVGTADGLYVNGSVGDMQFKFQNITKGDEILTLDITKSGDIWVGTHQDGVWWKPIGLSYFQHSQFGITDGNKNPNYVVLYIYADLDNNLWISTSVHGMWLYVAGEDASNTTSFIQLPGMKKMNANCIINIDNHSLWIGGGGLYKYEYTTDVKQATITDKQLPNQAINIIRKDQKGNTWLGTAKDGLWEERVGENKFTKNVGVSSQRVDTIVVSKKQRLWAGTNDGVWVESTPNSQTFIRNSEINEPVTVIAASTSTSSVDNNISVATLHNYDRYLKSKLWTKSANAIQILPGKNGTTYFNNARLPQVTEDIIFSGAFSIAIRTSGVYTVTINGKTVSNPKDNTFNFPNSTYDVIPNIDISLSVTFADKSKLSRSFLIKNDFFDAKKGTKDNLLNAFKQNDPDSKSKKSLTNVRIAGNRKNKILHLLYYLASPQNPNPQLEFSTDNFNFLIDKQKSIFWGEVKIQNGIVVPTPNSGKTFASLNSSFIIHDPFKTKSYITEMDLVDLVGNKYSFLIQVGGSKIDPIFSPGSTPKPNKPHKNLAAGVTVGTILLLIGLTLIWVGFRQNKRDRFRLNTGLARSKALKQANNNRVRHLNHNSQHKIKKLNRRKPTKGF